MHYFPQRLPMDSEKSAVFLFDISSELKKSPNRAGVAEPRLKIWDKHLGQNLGQTDGRMDGRTDRQTDGQKDRPDQI